MKVEERFSKVADLYDRHRPGYPAAVVEWLASIAGIGPGARVVELGCGTGIAARMFAAHSFDVTGVDPNEEMLAKARLHGGGPKYVRASAEATGLPEASFDFGYAAQAFHWFDVDRAMSELARVLRPGAWAAAFWNVRANTPAMDAYEALLLEKSDDYRKLARPADTIAAIAARVPVEERSFDHAQLFDWEAFRGRVHSSSYVAHGVDDLAAFDRALRAIFDAGAHDGTIEFAYRVDAIAWRAR